MYLFKVMVCDYVCLMLFYPKCSYYGAPPPVPSEQQNFLGNDVPNGSSDFQPEIKEHNNFTAPVPPCSSGEGLPYAPVDWPNPGDVWGWRVGKRVNSNGFYNDRFITVPNSIRMRNNPKVFASKPTLERFLQTHFPDADINAFFASFVWKIPATGGPPIEGWPGKKKYCSVLLAALFHLQ